MKIKLLKKVRRDFRIYKSLTCEGWEVYHIPKDTTYVMDDLPLSIWLAIHLLGYYFDDKLKYKWWRINR